MALFLAAFGFFLLTGSREPPWGDARPIWEVADALVRRGQVNIPTAWPPELKRGRDGKIYAVAPLLQSLVHVPGAALRRAVSAIAPASAPHTLPIASHVGPAALGAWLCVLFFGLARRLGGLRGAVIGTATLALGTSVWVYARSPYSESLQAVAFLGCFATLLALVRPFGRSPGPTSTPESVPEPAAMDPAATPLRLGLWLGALLAAKPVYALVAPGALALLFVANRERRHAWPRLAAQVALGAAPFVVLVLAYNWARWGSIFDAGYVLAPKAGVVRLSPFGENPLFGLLGLFASPGKSVFLYSPPLLLAALAMPAAWTRQRQLVLALVATVTPVLLFYGTFLFWAGDYAWGPRYLVPFLAPLLLPACLLLDGAAVAASRARAWLRKGLIVTVLGAGLGVQILGVAFFWDHYIRLSHEVLTLWLGEPNRSATVTPARDGLCGACFEDTHGLQWLPPFQPILGHAWLLRHVPFGHPWARAEQDAPWRKGTTLRLPLETRWAGGRLDWFALDLWRVNRPVTLGLVGLLGVGAAIALARFWRAVGRQGRSATGREAGGAGEARSPAEPT